MNTFAPWSEVVPDSLASDGQTIRLVGSEVTWAAQLHAGALPDDRTDKVYFRVRIDLGTATGSADAVAIGMYPNEGAVQVTYPASTFADGQYHYVAAPGTLTKVAYDRYAYLTGLNPSVKQIYIDHAMIVPA